VSVLHPTGSSSRAWRRLVTMAALLLAANSASAWSLSCAVGWGRCVQVQGQRVPVDDAFRMVEACRDFTRDNIGQRVVRMSVAEIHDMTRGRVTHPLLKASYAYDELLGSPLKFDRSLEGGKRYLAMRRACGQVFQAMRVDPPEDEDE